MPELPDIEHYRAALTDRIVGRRLTGIDISSPFLLRTVSPSVDDVTGKSVTEIRRIGKRIAIGLTDDHWMVIHLMIAGRLAFATVLPTKKNKRVLARFEFDSGALTLTEAGTKKRASLHLVKGAEDLAELDPNGLEPLEADIDAFTARLTLRNHTLKRALTDPRLFSGIGNAYSDEILHHAKLSPILQSQKMDRAQIEQLFDSVQFVLTEWSRRLLDEAKGEFPEKVTAFRPEMAVHGKFGQACPQCATEIQRIRYASNELNYCPRCQTNGKVLADRSLSRLLKKDWPKTIEELESAKRS